MLGTKSIKWNFTKFLVGRDGKVVKRYAPNDTPDSMRADIEAALAAWAGRPPCSSTSSRSPAIRS